MIQEVSDQILGADLIFSRQLNVQVLSMEVWGC